MKNPCAELSTEPYIFTIKEASMYIAAYTMLARMADRRIDIRESSDKRHEWRRVHSKRKV